MLVLQDPLDSPRDPKVPGLRVHPSLPVLPVLLVQDLRSSCLGLAALAESGSH